MASESGPRTPRASSPAVEFVRPVRPKDPRGNRYHLVQLTEYEWKQAVRPALVAAALAANSDSFTHAQAVILWRLSRWPLAVKELSPRELGLQPDANTRGAVAGLAKARVLINLGSKKRPVLAVDPDPRRWDLRELKP